MNVLSQEQKVIWLLTTSRRTGRRAEAVLRGLLNPEILAEVVWFADRPRNRNAMFLQAADFVLCGEDSMSMVHEALAADVKVVTLSPKLANPPMRYADKIKRLYADGYCSVVRFQHLERCRFRRLVIRALISSVNGEALLSSLLSRCWSVFDRPMTQIRPSANPDVLSFIVE